MCEDDDYDYDDDDINDDDIDNDDTFLLLIFTVI